MSNSINIDLKLTDGGSVKGITQETEKLNRELNEVAANANRAGAALSKAKPKAAAAAMERSGPSAAEVVNYNSARGSAGAAGGTARDFAAQAQGLGGLVRLYATFAANIFAVTTAYNALQNAFKTEKMIQAAEKFSGTVGVSMRSVAKSLQEATQYSLSFQDAVKFTNVGTAAGLAAKDIQNLTVIAKGAATALGRDVGESIQRIIQGTAKQEQEILDELGIFIKSKKAFEDYAKARNIKVDDLTAQQRTLAYAEAVAKAGEKWKEFATVDDPFGRLSAQLQNTLTEVLNLVNKIAVPLAKLFADSSDAILALGALITTSLLKRALPELKEGFLNLVTFDSKRAEVQSKALVGKLSGQLAILRAEAELTRKSLEEIALPDLGEKGVRKDLSSKLLDPDLIQKRAGKGMDYGLSAERLGNKLLNPDTLNQYKTLESIQKGMLAVENERMKSLAGNEAKQQQLLQALIKKGVYEKESTTENIILTAQANKQAEGYLAIINKTTLELEKQISAEARLDAIQAQEKGLVKTIEKAGGSTDTSKVVAAQTAAAAAIGATNKASKDNAELITVMTAKQVKAAQAAEALASNVLAGVGTAQKFKSAWADASTKINTQREAAANNGVIAQFKEMGTAITVARKEAVAASAGLTGVGAAAVKAGAMAAGAMGVLRAALSGVMAALGPIMIAWTVWELFGKSLFNFFRGITPELEKARERSEEMQKSFKQTVQDVGVAILKSQEYLNSTSQTSEGITQAYEKQARALESIASAYDAIIKAKEEEKRIESLSKPKDGSRSLNSNQATQVLNAEKTLAVLKSIDEGSTAVAKLEQSLSKLKTVLAGPGALFFDVRTSNAVKEVAAGLEEAEKAIVRVSPALAKQAAANAALSEATGKGVKSLGDFASGLDEINKIQAKNAGFNDVQAFKAYEKYAGSVDKLNKAREEGLPVTEKLLSSFVSEVDSFDKLEKALKATNKPYAEILAIKTALLRVSSAEAVLESVKSSGRSADIQAAAAAELAAARAEAAKVLASSKDAVQSATKSLGGLKGSTSQYTTEAKRGFKELEQGIRSAEAALKAMNAALEVSGKLNSLRSAFTGQQDLGNKQLAERVRLAQEEFKIEELKARLARDKVLLSKDNKGNKEVLDNANREYATTIASLAATRDQKVILTEIEVIEASRNENLRLIEERYRLTNEAADRILATARGHLEVEKAYADARAASLGLTSEQSRYETVLLDQQSKRLENAAKEQALLADAQKRRDEINAKAAAETTATKASSTGYLDKNDRLAIEGKLAEIEKAKAAELAKVNSESQKKLEQLDQEKTRLEEIMVIEEKRAKLIADQSSAAQKMAKLTTALVGAFKNTGMEKQATAVANVLKTTQSYQQRITKFDADNLARKDKNAKKIKQLEEEISFGSIEAAIEKAKLSETISKEEVKSIETRKELELDATIESLNSFKGMFEEKTAAYRVLDGIEKAMHIYKMAMMAKELAADVAATAKSIANSFARASADGTASITKTLASIPFPANVAAAAAVAAFVASLLGGSKGSSVPIAGMSAKDRQETQGTGMSWVNGQKVENGYGVFGDPTAKSKSIENSLEIIADNTIEGLGYDRKMLKALEAISNAIGNTAESLYTIAGIRSGSAFGTQETSVSSSGIKGLFGSSTTKDLVDSGIKVSGMFSDLAKGLGAFQQYETLQVTKKKSGLLGIGGSTSISYDTQTKALDASAKESIAEIFANATSLFETIGDKVGLTSEAIKAKLSTLNIDFEASLKGLNGKELEEALNAVISQSLDKASGMLFGDQFKKFQQFGEGLLETVVRVTDTNDKMKVAFSSIGMALAELSFESSESLAELLGGLEKFTEQIEFYRDTFLTESEKLAAVQSNVTKVMGDLLYSTVDTREEFKALVQSIDVTTASGRELYAELMAIAPAFAEVTAKHQELVDNYLELENELLGTFRDNAAAKALLTVREEEGLSAVAKAQLQRNKALQKEINTLNEYYELLDGLDEFVLTSAQIREKERNSIAESNRALYDLLQAYKDRQAAEETMQSAMSTINSTLSELASAAQAASDSINGAISSLVSGYLNAQSALTSAQNELANARSGLINGFFGAKDSLDNAKKGTGKALEGITKGYIAAQNAVDNAQKTLAQNTKNAAKQISDNLRRIGTSIKDFLTGLVTSDLSALDSTAKIRALQAQFDTLYTKALAGDTDAASELQNVGSNLLSASMESATSREEYSRKFGEITNKLASISTAFLDAAGPEQTVDDAQTNALETLANAQSELARWQAAVNESGAATALAEADLLEEWKEAKTAEEKANETFKKWSEAVSSALGFVPTEREDPTTKAISDAMKAYQEAMQKVSGAEVDVAAYQTALLQVGITDLSKLSQYGDSTNKNIEKYLSEWRQATTDQAAYAAKLAEAQELAKGISLTQVDQIAGLKAAIIEYNESSDLYKKSDDLIKNSSLENIRAAVESAQAGIVSAIAASSDSIVTVTKDIQESPTVKVPKGETTPVVVMPPPEIGIDPGSSYIPRWLSNVTDNFDFDNIGSAKQFAKGGYHSGGLRLVGEDGPEFEVTGPSRIFNAEKTQAILESSLGDREDSKLLRSLNQELRNMRTELAQLRAAASLTEQNTRKTKDMLENVTQGGDTLRTESA